MRSAIVIGNTCDWIIVGSSGFIGSHFLHSLSGTDAGHDSCQPNVVSLTHHYSESADVLSSLVTRYSSGNQIRVIYCAGKGGFSLSAAHALEQAYDFQKFISNISVNVEISQFILISSLGAHCSNIESPYRTLVMQKEADTILYLPDRSLILRLPSMYGCSIASHSFHGLIGIMYRNILLRKPTTITSRLGTRRNYLSMNNLSANLRNHRTNSFILDRYGHLNIQASLELTIHEICSCFHSVLHYRPEVLLGGIRVIDAEDHYPSRLYDARITLNDNLPSWIQWQQTRCSLLFPL